MLFNLLVRQADLDENHNLCRRGRRRYKASFNKVPRAALFVAQGDHGIDLHSAAYGDVASDQSRNQQQT